MIYVAVGPGVTRLLPILCSHVKRIEDITNHLLGNNFAEEIRKDHGIEYSIAIAEVNGQGLLYSALSQDFDDAK